MNLLVKEVKELNDFFIDRIVRLTDEHPVKILNEANRIFGERNLGSEEKMKYIKEVAPIYNKAMKIYRKSSVPTTDLMDYFENQNISETEAKVTTKYIKGRGAKLNSNAQKWIIIAVVVFILNFILRRFI